MANTDKIKVATKVRPSIEREIEEAGLSSEWRCVQENTIKSTDDGSDDDEPMELDEPDTPPILQLPAEVLYMVFDRCTNATLVCLSETCVRFANLMDPKIVDKPYLFPNIDKTLEVNDKTTVTEVHKLVRLMGCHFETLALFVNGRNYKMVAAYMPDIVKYCTNIQHMGIFTHTLRCELFRLVQAIFNNLKTLKITEAVRADPSDLDPETDFTELLPKLEEIDVTNKLLKYCLKKSWPSLHTMHSHQEFCDGEEIFFQINPQLRRLVLWKSGVRNLKHAADHLPNLGQLKFDYRRPDADQFDQFDRFKNLTELDVEMMQRGTVNDLSEIIVKAKNVKKLRMGVLRFFSRFPYMSRDVRQLEAKSAIAKLAKELASLEQCKLLYQPLDESVVVDFVRYASKLKSLHLHQCGVSATASLLARLVDVRKCNHRENQNKLELIVDDEGDQSDMDAVNENETQQYLSVKIHKN